MDYTLQMANVCYTIGMGPSVETRRFTIQEYLEMEEKAVGRHEFHDGVISALDPCSYRHSKINVNLIKSIHAALKCDSCDPLGIDMRVRIARLPHYVYPDIKVICGKPQFDSDAPDQTAILNPRVVIEVLSESTELYDRGAKFDLYRQIPSLEEYVLISQWQPMVETYLRQPQENTWLFSPFKGPLATLRSLQINLPFSEIYAGIDFKT
jgi:Uma2 family endonuclease